MLDIILDALMDTLKLVPFLLITYLFMESLEHRISGRTKGAIEHAGKWGPLAGGILGALPQCGFSAAAASLYAGGVVSLGTLLAVFLSTSDEMLPVMISGSFPVGEMIGIVVTKLLIGIAVGLAADFILGRHQELHHKHEIEDVCRHEHCQCNGTNIFLSALRHTAIISAYIFVLSLVLGLIMEQIGQEQLAEILSGHRVLGHFLCGIVGMIPNCATSVAITQLFMDGFITKGMLFSGLLAGSGTGLMVLFKVMEDKRTGVKVTGLLYLVSLICGFLIDVFRGFSRIV